MKKQFVGSNNPKPMWEFNIGEGGEYLDDYIKKHPDDYYDMLIIDEGTALAMLAYIDMKRPINKAFVCTSKDETSATILNSYDFGWQLYKFKED